MRSKLARRDVFKPMAAASLAVVAPSLWLGCSKTLHCTDEAGLTAEELKIRNDTAQYMDQTLDATKHCAVCSQFHPPADEGRCGSCEVVKGPINPSGYCKLFNAKTTP